MKHWSEEKIRRDATKWRSGLKVVRREISKPRETEEDLSGNALKLLLKADAEPAIPLTHMDAELSLNTEQGQRARKELIARGYVRQRAMVREGRGGGIKVLEVTGAGQAVLRLKGFTPKKKLVGRGDWLHSVAYPTWIKRWCEARRYKAWFERTLGNKAFDAVYSNKDGRLFGIEIVLSGSVKYNVNAALKAFEIHGIDEVLMAFDDSKLRKAVEKKLKEDMFVSRSVHCISLGKFAPVEKRES